MHLNLNLNTTGFHRAAWRAPDGHRFGFVEIDHYLQAAALAEKGLFDAVFLADYMAIGEAMETEDSLALDPVVVAASILARTSRIGVIVTASTTYHQPYALARALSSLDHAGRGRIGWNVVTSMHAHTSGNFGLDRHPDSATRWARAHEFLAVAGALWESWDEGALQADRAGGTFADTTRIRAINHRGPHFAVTGPLQLPRSPQVRPLIVQAGPSEGGRAFASAHADPIFTGQHSLEAATLFHADIRNRSRAAGRAERAVAILPGLHITLGDTEREAWDRLNALEELILAAARIASVARALGLDPAALHLDQPVPGHLLDGLETVASPLEHGVRDLLRKDRLTVRQISAGGYTAHKRLVGTPEQVADQIADWFERGIVDGFNISGDVYPSGLTAIVDGVIPILQRRGLFRTAYRDETLRDRYAAPWPGAGPADPGPRENRHQEDSDVALSQL
ncbi:FMN-dependent oxidoreductase, nitrilotriacetate monooxygenase family [Rhodobacter sp. 24-YEA-8]|nr:FMN-dependent oxidoreductase, nitrilotriacetate monooxygenase family [Rhodobacter sp. 24-YEA-8]